MENDKRQEEIEDEWIRRTKDSKDDVVGLSNKAARVTFWKHNL